MNYRHTHYSVHDGSPAMLVHETEAGHFLLTNEDGYEWLAEPEEWSEDPMAYAKTCPPIPGMRIE